MNKIYSIMTLAALALTGLGSCAPSAPEREVYLFTSHREPALDGLHFLYSYDAYHWDSLPGVWLKPEIGNDKPFYNFQTQQVDTPKYYPQPMMRDPSLTQGPDGTFHLVWTLAWDGSQAFGHASSKDLIHWSQQQAVPVMKDSLTNNVWAPEVYYDDVKQQYLIVWSSAIPAEQRTEADNLGQNKAHRSYYTTTRDFQTFTPAQRFYDPGFNSIDGFILKRAPGDYVFIVKDNRKPGYSDLFCAFGTTAEGPYAHPSAHFAPTYSEGACAIPVGHKWLIYFDVYKEYRYGTVETRDFQTFTPVDDQTSFPKGHKHGTVVKVKESVLRAMMQHCGMTPQ